MQLGKYSNGRWLAHQHVMIEPSFNVGNARQDTACQCQSLDLNVSICIYPYQQAGNLKSGSQSSSNAPNCDAILARRCMTAHLYLISAAGTCEILGSRFKRLQLLQRYTWGQNMPFMPYFEHGTVACNGQSSCKAGLASTQTCAWQWLHCRART